MRRKVVFSIIIIGLVVLSIGIGWTVKHPKHLPLDRINIENAQLKQHQYARDNIASILNDLESFHFKRDKRFGDSVGWTLGISWSNNDKARWMTLYDNCIEYEGYLYTTEYVEEYSEYWSQLLGLFEDTST